MKYTKPLYDINSLKNNTINQILVVFSLLSVLSESLVLVRVLKYGADLMVILNFSKTVALWIVTLLRHRIKLKHKVAAILGVACVGLVTGLFNVGFLAPAKVFIIVVPLFLSFVVAYRQAVKVLASFVGIYLLFAFLYTQGFVSYSIDPTTYANSLLGWLIDSVVFSLISWGLLYVGCNYNASLLGFNRKIKAQHVDLVDKEKKYSALFDESAIIILLLKLTGEVLDGNRAACAFLEVSKEELLNKNLVDFSPEHQEDGQLSAVKAERLIAATVDGGCQQFDWEYITGTGEASYVFVSMNRVQLSGVTYVQAVMSDITEKRNREVELERYKNDLELLVKDKTEGLEIVNEELVATNDELIEKGRIILMKNIELEKTLSHLKETQAQLIQADKMASIGILTAGVAHEINNPLNYMMGAYVGLNSYFERYGSQDVKVTDFLLSSMYAGIEKASKIVKGLSQFSLDNCTDEECDINTILDNCLAILQNNMLHRIEVRKMYNKGPIAVYGNVGKLHQVFTNVITNAIQAIADTGEILIETKVQGDYVVVEIVDDGCGIKVEHIAHVTDPFFTTKPPGEGTGLGLSIGYSIIKEHKGSMKLESEYTKGTKVTIEIPIKKNN